MARTQPCLGRHPQFQCSTMCAGRDSAWGEWGDVFEGGGLSQEQSHKVHLGISPGEEWQGERGSPSGPGEPRVA